MQIKSKSIVLNSPATESEKATLFFSNKLSYETDPADIYADMKNNVNDFTIIDVRTPEDFAERHIAGAINLPIAKINANTTSTFPKDKLLVVYCWSPACNGSTKAAMKLSALGFTVKEMIGGIQYWENYKNYPVESS